MDKNFCNHFNKYTEVLLSGFRDVCLTLPILYDALGIRSFYDFVLYPSYFPVFRQYIVNCGYRWFLAGKRWLSL